MSILDDIIDHKKEEISRLRRDFNNSHFEDSELFEKQTLKFVPTLPDNNLLGIIAEIKKASPSRGLIRENFDHYAIAKTYFNNHVNAVSILTDQIFFQGSLVYLADIARIKTAPLLRKDFILDEIQIMEARSNGADIILLIAEALSPNQIKDLSQTAYALDMEVLLELHSREQLEKIDFHLNKLIGINNRDLNTFKTDLKTTEKISKILPAHVSIISESGIKTDSDIRYLRDTPTRGILVGEHLMASNNIEVALKELKNWCTHAD